VSVGEGDEEEEVVEVTKGYIGEGERRDSMYGTRKKERADGEIEGQRVGQVEERDRERHTERERERREGKRDREKEDKKGAPARLALSE
jgi:hypothetical protein